MIPTKEQGPVSGGASSRRARVLGWADLRAVPLRAILVTVGVVVVVWLGGQLLYRLRDVVLLMVVGSFVALILNPLVVALQRWKIRRRGTSVAIVTSWFLLIFVGLAFAFGYPLVNSLTHFSHALPTYVANAQHGKGWVGHLVRKYHVEAWVQKNSPKLVSFAESLGRPALSLGKGAFAILAELAATFAFVIMLLVEAPKIRAALLDMMSPERATRYAEIGSKVSSSISGFVVGDFLTSVIAGTVVFVTLAILGVPYALLFGLWVALVDFLPQIGGALAGIPTVLFALSHSLTAGVVTLVVFLAYTFLENHFLNPVVMARTVKINPLLVFAAVLVGADVGNWLGGLFGGFVAVLLAVPIAASLQVIIVEIWKTTTPKPTAEAKAPTTGSSSATDVPTATVIAREGHGSRPDETTLVMVPTDSE
jgi:predicted PurR-regulated permease PerM